MWKRSQRETDQPINVFPTQRRRLGENEVRKKGWRVKAMGGSRVLTEEMKDLLDKELNRLYKAATGENAEVAKWAQDRIVEIQKTILTLAASATATAADASPTVQTVTEIVSGS
jgi:hypothetical protein